MDSIFKSSPTEAIFRLVIAAVAQIKSKRVNLDATIHGGLLIMGIDKDNDKLVGFRIFKPLIRTIISMDGDYYYRTSSIIDIKLN